METAINKALKCSDPSLFCTSTSIKSSLLLVFRRIPSALQSVLGPQQRAGELFAERSPLRRRHLSLDSREDILCAVEGHVLKQELAEAPRFMPLPNRTCSTPG